MEIALAFSPLLLAPSPDFPWDALTIGCGMIPVPQAVAPANRPKKKPRQGGSFGLDAGWGQVPVWISVR